MTLDPDELAVATERAELETRLLEAALDGLHPGGQYRRRRGPTVPANRSGDELGRARFRHDHAAARRDWLLERYEQHAAQAERRQRYQAAAQQGLARFTAGRYSLDRLVETTRQTPAALSELREQRLERQQEDRAATEARLQARRTAR